MSSRVSFNAKRLFALVSCLVVFCAGSTLAALAPLDFAKVKPVQMNNLEFSDNEFVIAGKIFKDRLKVISLWENPCYGTWKVPSGFTSFVGVMGVSDSAKHFAGGPVTDEAELTIYVDGEKAAAFSAKQGDSSIPFSVPVSAGQALKLEFTHYSSIAEPRFVASAAASSTSSSSSSGTSIQLTPVPGSTPVGILSTSVPGGAPFVVEPRDLETLAQKLRESVNANSSLKSRMENALMAITIFDLVDISSKSVAKNVADDLYTSMIKCAFSPVERGQIDKILSELKIDASGLIDPKTAQKIGQMSGCDVILLGSISDRGQMVVVNARLMETATGKSIVAERVEMRKVSINR